MKEIGEGNLRPCMKQQGRAPSILKCAEFSLKGRRDMGITEHGVSSNRTATDNLIDIKPTRLMGRILTSERHSNLRCIVLYKLKLFHREFSPVDSDNRVDRLSPNIVLDPNG
jgi:hypothetical protein